MKNKNILILCLVIITLSFCNEIEVDDDFPKFKKLEILPPENTELQGKELLNPWAISIVDSVLIVIENGVSRDIITSFSLKNCKIIFSFGSRGRGPNEFSEIIQQPVSVVGKEITSIQIFDWVNKRLDEYLIDTINDVANEPLRRYILPPELMLVQRAAFLNDTTVIAMGDIYNNFLAFANTNTDEVSYINFYPIKDNNNYSNRDVADIYLGDFAINYKQNLIAVASKFIPEILIIDFDGKVIKKITISEYDLGKIIKKPDDDRIIQFHDITVTEEYIYAVHIGKSYSELEKILENNASSQTPVYISEIHIYDWNGKPINKIALKGGYYPFIEIDKQNNRIFSIDLFSQVIDILNFNSETNLK